jgi:hypothetical protein
MRSLAILLMTLEFASVLSTVERAVTLVRALERSDPLLDSGSALLFFFPIGT